jgi:hypothetical protein
MQSTIAISGKLLGKSKPLFTDWYVPLPPEIFGGGQHLTLRDLLVQIVSEEIDAFRTRQEQKRLISVLSKTQIEQGKRQGKIDMGGKDYQQDVDPQAAIDNVLQAFEDGLYYVFIDDEQQEALDQQVYLKPDSQLLFLRLVPLVGG